MQMLNLITNLFATDTYLLRSHAGITLARMTVLVAWILGAYRLSSLPVASIRKFRSMPESENVIARFLDWLTPWLENTDTSAVETLRLAMVVELGIPEPLPTGQWTLYLDGITVHRWLTGVQANWYLAYGYSLSFEVRNPQSKLERFKHIVRCRMTEGQLNAVKILAELKAIGYTGSITILKDFMAPLRPSSKVKAKATATATKQPEMDSRYLRSARIAA